MIRSILAVIALAVVVAPVRSFAAAEGTKPVNIVHIIADDVGYDDVGCYGAPKIKTPNIDKLAAEGVRFTSFYAPSPTCTPSRMAMLTGCYAERTGVARVLFPNDNIGISDREITIAQLLKQRGYATALIGKWHLGCLPQFLPTRHGFDSFYGTVYPNDHGPERKNSNGQKEPFPPIPLYRDEKIVEQPAKLAACPDRFTDEAIKFITANKDRPFYLHLANIETHTPWFVAKRWEGHSADGAYGDAVESLDWTVGQVMETLKKLSVDQNTLVVFNSDNGPLWQRAPELERIYGKYGTVDTSRPHLLRGGKYQARLEGGTRVPMIARWPGKIAPAKTCDELAMGFDLFNTFAGVAGANMLTDRIIDGKDILPLMRGDAGAKSPHESFYYYQHFRLMAVRDAAGMKLMLANGPAAPKDHLELYDVMRDPGEAKDVIEPNAEAVKRLQDVAAAARKDLGDDRKGMPGDNRRKADVAGDTPVVAP